LSKLSAKDVARVIVCIGIIVTNECPASVSLHLYPSAARGGNPPALSVDEPGSSVGCSNATARARALGPAVVAHVGVPAGVASWAVSVPPLAVSPIAAVSACSLADPPAVHAPIAGSADRAILAVIISPSSHHARPGGLASVTLNLESLGSAAVVSAVAEPALRPACLATVAPEVVQVEPSVPHPDVIVDSAASPLSSARSLSKLSAKDGARVIVAIGIIVTDE